MYFLHVLLQILIQLFTYCLDKSFAVQNGRIFNAGDQCQVFCHLSAFNRGKGCFFQFVCKYAKLRNLIQFTAFAECPGPCKDCCHGVRGCFFAFQVFIIVTLNRSVSCFVLEIAVR